MIPSIFELMLGDQWTDITSDVYQRDDATIIRGRPDEGSKTDPGKMSLTLNNRGGRYSPRNPESDLYGQLGRNTPVRVRQGTRVRALALPGVSGAHVSTPDDPAYDVTDLDVRVEVTPATWRPEKMWELAAKSEGGDASWNFRVLTTGELEIGWYSGGSRTAIRSTVPVAVDAGRLAVRGTLDVDNGSGVYEVRFYTADSIDGTWTLLGDPITGSATTNIDTSDAAELTLGASTGGHSYFTNGQLFQGTIHAFRLLDSIGGAPLADIGSLSDAEPGVSTFVDDAGLVWTLHDPARVTDESVRMVGEVAAWPTRWDVSGSDVYTPIEAAGLLRRLGNANSPLRSTIYRGTVNRRPGDPTVVAYWPMEDGADAVSLASAFDDPPMSIIRNPVLADYDGWVASEPVPTLQDGQLVATVSDYTSTDKDKVQFLLHAPDGGVGGARRLVELRTTGSARLWRLEIDDAGDLRMLVFDPTGVEIDSTAWIAYNLNGLRCRISIEITQDGPDISWLFAMVEVGEDAGGFTDSIIAGHTAGRITQIRFGADYPDSMGDTAIGHLAVQNEINSIFELARQTDAWRGETAGRRIARLCHEEGITLGVEGDLDDTAAMGPQGIATLLDLLRECAAADMGVLSELRDSIGLHYRTRKSLYNRPVKASLDYAGGELAPPLEPVEDDSTISNDVTVKRRDGSSARVVQETGPLSIQPPPEGVGRYDASVTLNVHKDDQVRQQAEWRLHAGTIDQLRYPTITVQASDTAGLYERVAPLRPGDRVQITNPPSWLPPHVIDLTVEGTEETLNPFLWEWQANTSPAVVHEVFEIGHDTYGRLATDGSELDTAIDATQTSVPVLVTAGPAWTTDAADLPLDVVVGGERMTVTGIGSPTSGVQTFTVERSVNGISKSHAAGTPVQVADLGVLALG